MAGTPNFSKPRLWVKVDSDYTDHVHLSTGFSSILSQKHSSLELYDMPYAPEASSPRYPLSRFSSQCQSRPQSWTPGSSRSPPIPPRAPARSASASGSTRSTNKLLRRKHSPVVATLREIREQQSEAQLRAAYEAQTLAYINDSLPKYGRRKGTIDTGHSRWSSDSEGQSEDDADDDDPDFVLAPEHW